MRINVLYHPCWPAGPFLVLGTVYRNSLQSHRHRHRSDVDVVAWWHVGCGLLQGVQERCR
jgi:hypothetical protein